MNEKLIGQTEPDNKFELKVKFNKKEQILDEQTAKDYAEMGMKYEQLLPMLKKANFLAAREDKSFSDFIEDLAKEKDATIRTRFKEKIGDDDDLIEKLLELENQKAGKKYDDLMAQRNKSDDNGFEKIKSEFDDFKSIEDLPEEVSKIANNEKINLFDALLRYKFKQNKLSNNEKKNQQKNGSNTTGSQKNLNTANGSTSVGALMKGIWG